MADPQKLTVSGINVTSPDYRAVGVGGTGAGFAASFGKVGAVLTAFLFPILLKDIGTDFLLLILVGTSLLGAVVTRAYAFETKGISLEKLDAKGPIPPAKP